MVDEETVGPPMSDVWEVGVNASISKERTGYPTQKPLKLLERVILSASNAGDVVLDPFCGCGTAVLSAQTHGRRWIGIDVAHLAIEIVEDRLRRDHGLARELHYTVNGEPHDAASAGRLAADNPWEFQRWAVAAIGAEHLGADGKMKMGGDRGIDGFIRFQDDPRGERSKRVLVSVKAGSTGPVHVRELRGVIERELAPVGVLVTLHPATAGMRREAAVAGTYRGEPRIQIISVEDFFGGKRPTFPGENRSRVSSRPPPAILSAAEDVPSSRRPGIASVALPTRSGRRGGRVP